VPTIHVIPVGQGMGQQELQSRLMSGWVLVGRQAINMAGQIIDPSKPMTPTGIIDVDVWMLPEPTIPAGIVIAALVKAHQEGQAEPGLMLDSVCRALFGEGIVPMAEKFEAARERQTSAAEVEGKPSG